MIKKINTGPSEIMKKNRVQKIVYFLKEAWRHMRDYFMLREDVDTPDNLKDFVTDADYYILHQQPLRGMLIIRIGIVVVVSFFIWAAFTDVDELVKADAKVVPSSQLQVLQSMDGGIVQKILVKEGQAVKSGQPLLEIDSTRFMSSVRESQAQNIALAARAERLNALLENRVFKVPANVSPQVQEVYSQEQ
ncbi:MAG: HlyD-family type secretion protein, partial [Pseudomonadota bacterium]